MRRRARRSTRCAPARGAGCRRCSSAWNRSSNGSSISPLISRLRTHSPPGPVPERARVDAAGDLMRLEAFLPRLPVSDTISSFLTISRSTSMLLQLLVFLLERGDAMFQLFKLPSKSIERIGCAGDCGKENRGSEWREAGVHGCEWIVKGDSNRCPTPVVNRAARTRSRASSRWAQKFSRPMTSTSPLP